MEDDYRDNGVTTPLMYKDSTLIHDLKTVSSQEGMPPPTSPRLLSTDWTDLLWSLAFREKMSHGGSRTRHLDAVEKIPIYQERSGKGPDDSRRRYPTRRHVSPAAAIFPIC